VDVVLLPATLRVYLVTRRQSSTQPLTEVAITTGQFNTSGYRGAFLKRWRSGLGVSAVADWNDITGPEGSATTAYHDVNIWLKAEYAPSPKVGVSYQRPADEAAANDDPVVDPVMSRRLEQQLRFFLASREDGLGPRLDLTLAHAAASRDSDVANSSLSQANLELSILGSRASAALIARTEDDRMPLVFEGRVAWVPLHPITFSADARHATYSMSRSGRPGAPAPPASHSRSASRCTATSPGRRTFRPRCSRRCHPGDDRHVGWSAVGTQMGHAPRSAARRDRSNRHPNSRRGSAR
jgi:hypothetical protein